MVSSGRCVADRPIRWRGGAPAGRRRSRRSRLSARWAPRLVPATAWTSSTMTCSTPRRISRAWLVSSRYRLSGVVTRMSGGWRDQVAAGVCGRVAGARGDRDARHVGAEARGGERDAGERRPEVALHVVGERLERADVQRPDRAGLASGRGRARLGGDAVKAPQERGEGLAAPRRRVDQRVLAAGDRRPAAGLGVGGGLERRLEPGPDGGPERSERIGAARGHGTASIGVPLRSRTDVRLSRWTADAAAPRNPSRRTGSARRLECPRVVGRPPGGEAGGPGRR